MKCSVEFKLKLSNEEIEILDKASKLLKDLSQEMISVNDECQVRGWYGYEISDVADVINDVVDYAKDN